MRVRLAAEEYSNDPSICARIPSSRSALLRRRLGLPLACRAGDRPRNPLRLRGHAVQPALARPGSSGPCNGHACAEIRACYEPRSRDSFIRGEGCTTLVGHRRTARSSFSYFVAGSSEGRRSETAAAEPPGFPAAANLATLSAAPSTIAQSSAATPAAYADGVGRDGTG
jgi:hypothetical protein